MRYVGWFLWVCETFLVLPAPELYQPSTLATTDLLSPKSRWPFVAFHLNRQCRHHPICLSVRPLVELTHSFGHFMFQALQTAAVDMQEWISVDAHPLFLGTHCMMDCGAMLIVNFSEAAGPVCSMSHQQ